MNILLIILLILAGITALCLIAALFMKKDHYVKREIIIDVPAQTAYDYLKLLKNQDKFNKWAKDDPDRNWQYKGTDGTVGFIISWNGNKQAGEGEKEIMQLEEGRRIATQIRFKRPMVTSADIVMETIPVTDRQTRVSMSNAGTLKYPVNLMIPIAERAFPKDLEESLLKLKNILEHQ